MVDAWSETFLCYMLLVTQIYKTYWILVEHFFTLNVVRTNSSVFSSLHNVSSNCWLRVLRVLHWFSWGFHRIWWCISGVIGSLHFEATWCLYLQGLKCLSRVRASYPTRTLTWFITLFIFYYEETNLSYLSFSSSTSQHHCPLNASTALCLH